MNAVPKWFRAVAVAALIWNLLGCAAYLADVRLTPADIAKLTAAQQAMYAARPVWAVGATAIAVWFGALGCVGLIVRKRWSQPLLVLSLLGVIVQDIALFGIAHAASGGDLTPVVLQTVVLLVAIALVWLARKAARQGWIS